MASGVGTERAARVVGALETVHTKALGHLQTTLSARDGKAGISTFDRIARRAIIADKLLGGLLLRRREPMPQNAFKKTPDRAGRESGLRGGRLLQLGRCKRTIQKMLRRNQYERAVREIGEVASQRG